MHGGFTLIHTKWRDICEISFKKNKIKFQQVREQMLIPEFLNTGAKAAKTPTARERWMGMFQYSKGITVYP